MDFNIEIKEEVPASEFISQTERESSSQDIKVKLNSDATICNKICEIKTKTEIKEESHFSDLNPQNEWQLLTENVLMNVLSHKDYKLETKREINEETTDLDFCVQNASEFFSEDPAMKTNESNEVHEMDIKLEIKDELCWLERASTEAAYVNVSKDCVVESLPSTESIRLYQEELSRGKSFICLDENFGNNQRFNMGIDTPECKATRKYRSKETNVPEISPIKKSIYSEQYHVGKMDSKASCIKQNTSFQLNSTQVHDFNMKTYCFKSAVVQYKSVEYKCDICQKIFTSSLDLKIHSFNHKGKKTHKCNICGKSFNVPSDLKRHQLTHEGIRPYKCDTCGKSFTELSKLKRHESIHIGINSYKCDTCSKCFAHLSHLQKHKFIHERISPHNCDICGKCFAERSRLKKHKLIHGGIKPYKCDTCGKCFVELSKLKRHKSIHIGIKPYKCDICLKCFVELSQLKRHKSIHEAIKPHKCDTCGKCFGEFSKLKRHKSIHGGIKP